MKKGLSALSHNPNQHHNGATRCGNTTVQTLTLGDPVTTESQVPFLQVITHMHRYVMLEGLFRKPGNKSRIELLIAELSKSGVHGVVANINYSGHDHASVLKQFLSELPEPLLVKRYLDAYLQASGTVYTVHKLLIKLTSCYQFYYCSSSTSIKSPVYSVAYAPPSSILSDNPAKFV